MKSQRFLMRSVRRGSALLTVLVVVLVLSVICGSMLYSVSAESGLARRTGVTEQLKYTTDTVLNYAYAQVAKNPVKYSTSGNTPDLPPASLFAADDPSGGTSTVTGTARSYNVSNSNYDIIMVPLTPQSNGTVAGYQYDTNSPINANLSLAKTGVTPSYLRSIGVIAAKSAVAVPTAPASQAADPTNTGAHVYEYSALVVEYYTLGIFNYLGFFDVGNFRIDNPGSNITLNGPIQANKGVSLISSGQTSVVSFLSKLSTPGIFSYSGSTTAGRYMISDGTKFDASGIPVANVDMYSPTVSGQLRETSDDYSVGKDGVLGTADDVVKGNTFQTFMLNKTLGNLSTGETGASSVTLQGAGYKTDTDPTVLPSMTFANNRIIDPPNPSMAASTATADQQAVEAAKIARQASMYVYVEQSGAVTVFVNQTTATYQNGVTASDAYQAALTYKALTSDSARAAWKASTANQAMYLDPTEASSFITLPTTSRYYADTIPTALSKYTDVPNNAIFDSQQKSTVSMVDINVGTLNAKLNPTNAAPGVATSGSLKTKSGTWSASSKTGWNGVMYVDVQNPSARMTAPISQAVTGYPVNGSGLPLLTLPVGTTQLTATQPSLILPNTKAPVAWDTGSTLTASSDSGLTAVRIKNATTVPGAQSSLSDTLAGFTLATNTATYTVGSFNADGKDNGTGSTSLQDAQSTTADAMKAYNAAGATVQAIPAAIMSDKNVALSANFSDLAGLRVGLSTSNTYPPGFNSSNWSKTFDTTTSSFPIGSSSIGYYQYQLSPGSSSSPAVMELNAGFIIGDDTVSAVTNGTNTNAGMHTIISFLQPFSPTSDSLIMRGAIAGIYQSRYFTAKAGSFYDYYIAPQRRYGFSTLFQSGLMPPATPTVAHFRKIRKFILTQSAYNALKTSGVGPSTVPKTVAGWLDQLQYSN